VCRLELVPAQPLRFRRTEAINETMANVKNRRIRVLREVDINIGILFGKNSGAVKVCFSY